MNVLVIQSLTLDITYLCVRSTGADTEGTAGGRGLGGEGDSRRRSRRGREAKSSRTEAGAPALFQARVGKHF